MTLERQSLQALAESQARLEEAQRIAGMGWWEADVRSGEMQLSQELLHLLGWKRQPTQRWQELRHMFIHPEDLARVEAAMIGQLPLERPASLEHRVVLPDGTVRQWQLHAQSFQDRHGRTARLAGTVLDVTALRQAEAENFRARQLEALDLLSAGIAHGFNNLLSVIQGNLTLARVMEPVGPTLPLLAETEVACEQAARLARQLAQYARVGAPRDCAPTEVGLLLAEVVPFLLRGSRVGHPAGRSGQHRAPWGGPGGAPAAGCLRAPAHRGLRARHRAGAPAAHLRPYFTTRQEGHGLGLATTHAIVRRHRGHISVRSRPGCGAVFEIYLPVAREASSGAAATGQGAPAQLQRQLKVLLGDDDAMVRRVGAQLLGELGCEVEVAGGGEEAVAAAVRAMAAGRPYDLAILDVTMSGDLSASEVLRRLRDIDPALRAVVSSGHPLHETMLRPRDKGFCATLTKPYGLSDLRAAVAAAMGQSAASIVSRRPSAQPADAGQRPKPDSRIARA